MFNVSQLYSVPKFLRANFSNLVIMNEPSLLKSRKKRDVKVDLNTSKKLLVFVTIRQGIVYEKFIFTQK